MHSVLVGGSHSELAAERSFVEGWAVVEQTAHSRHLTWRRPCCYWRQDQGCLAWEAWRRQGGVQLLLSHQFQPWGCRIRVVQIQGHRCIGRSPLEHQVLVDHIAQDMEVADSREGVVGLGGKRSLARSLDREDRNEEVGRTWGKGTALGGKGTVDLAC